MSADPRLGEDRDVPLPWEYADTYGHGPVLLTTLPDRPARAHCCHPGCGWSGPDRDYTHQGVRLALDDACQHWHTEGYRCGRCFWCVEAPRCGVCGRPRSVGWAAWVRVHRFPCGHCDEHSEEN